MKICAVALKTGTAELRPRPVGRSTGGSAAVRRLSAVQEGADSTALATVDGFTGPAGAAAAPRGGGPAPGPPGTRTGWNTMAIRWVSARANHPALFERLGAVFMKVARGGGNWWAKRPEHTGRVGGAVAARDPDDLSPLTGW